MPFHYKIHDRKQRELFFSWLNDSKVKISYFDPERFEMWWCFVSKEKLLNLKSGMRVIVNKACRFEIVYRVSVWKGKYSAVCNVCWLFIGFVELRQKTQIKLMWEIFWLLFHLRGKIWLCGVQASKGFWKNWIRQNSSKKSFLLMFFFFWVAISTQIEIA